MIDKFDYDEVVRSLGGEIILQEKLGSYQGDLIYLIYRFDPTDHRYKYAIVVLSFGSCSVCDFMESITPRYYGFDVTHLDQDELAELKEETATGLKELNDYRDSVEANMKLMSPNEMILYLLSPDRSLSWWGNEADYLTFVQKAVENIAKRGLDPLTYEGV